MSQSDRTPTVLAVVACLLLVGMGVAFVGGVAAQADGPPPQPGADNRSSVGDGEEVPLAGTVPTAIDYLDTVEAYDENATLDGQPVEYDDVLVISRAFSTATAVPGPVSSGATPDVVVSAPDAVQPGETVAVTVNLTNAGDVAANAAGLQLTPAGTVELGRIETAGTTATARGSVFYRRGLRGETQTTTFEFTIPENTSTPRNLTLDGRATVGNQTDITARVLVRSTGGSGGDDGSEGTTGDDGAVPLAGTVPTRLDVLSSIDAYAATTTLDGQSVEYDDVLAIVRAFETAGVVPGPVSAGAIPDVSVGTPDAVRPGETFDVRYELGNAGDSDANAAGVQVDLPPAVELDSVETEGTAVPERGSVFLTDGLSAGATETVELELSLASNTSRARNLTLDGHATIGTRTDANTTVRVSDTDPGPGEGDDGSGGDHGGDDSESETFLRVDEQSVTVASDGETTLSYTVENTASQATSYTLAVESLPRNLTVTGFSGDVQASNPDGPRPTASTASLAPGGTGTVRVTYRASAAASGTSTLGVSATDPLSGASSTARSDVTFGASFLSADSEAIVPPGETDTLTYTVENTANQATSYTLAVDRLPPSFTVTDISGDVQSSSLDGAKPTASTIAVPAGGTARVTVTYRASTDASGTSTIEASATEPLSGVSSTATTGVTVSAVPTDPRARALQIASRSSAGALTQNDVTVAITRFERGTLANGVDIAQNDITVLITLFERR
jgi:hypothetical protein